MSKIMNKNHLLWQAAGEGARRITDERLRQFDEEGYTAEHDAHHDDSSMLEAAMRYLVFGGYVAQGLIPTEAELPPGPRWDEGWFKPDESSAVRNLEKAGALIAAEIDRLLAEEES